MRPIHSYWIAIVTAAIISTYSQVRADPAPFLRSFCFECHDSDSHEGNLDLTALKLDPSSPENFARWVKIHDRIESGEMPPKSSKRPPASDSAAVTQWLQQSLIAAERVRLDGEGRCLSELSRHPRGLAGAT